MSARKAAAKKATGATAPARPADRPDARSSASTPSSTTKRSSRAKEAPKETGIVRSSGAAPKATPTKKSAGAKTGNARGMAKKAATTKTGAAKATGARATAKATGSTATTKKTATTKQATAGKRAPTAPAPAQPAGGTAAKRAAKTTDRTPSTKKAAVTKNSNGGASHQASGSPSSDRPKRSRATAAGDDEVQFLTRSLKVKDDEAPWTAAELREIGRFLREEIASYERDIEQSERELVALLHTTADGAGDDQADAGARTFEREHEIALANNSRDMLAQSERALDRLAAGTYGMCENCGNPIGKGRLQVFPRATLCMTCKTKQERH